MAPGIFVVLISALVFGFVAKRMAASKKMSPNSAFWFGFFLGPIGLIIVALAADKTYNQVRVPDEKTFPMEGYSGEPNVELPAYRLFLAEHFDIRHNNVVGTYSVDAENVFSNLEDAILYCDGIYRGETSLDESFSDFVKSHPLSDDQINAITRNVQKRNGFSRR